MIVIMMLKKSCIVAVETALPNSDFFVICPKDTIELVTEVPILAPIIKKTADSTLSVVLATIITTMLVVAELLCTTAVASIPINKQIKGLEVLEIISPAISFATNPRHPLSALIENKNNSSIARKSNTFTTSNSHEFLCQSSVLKNFIYTTPTIASFTVYK